MKVVKILTSDGKLLATYPDATVYSKDKFLYVFDINLSREQQDCGKNGNWMACFSGPIIAWEEEQKDGDN